MQALVAGKSTRRNRNSGGGKGGKGVSNGTAADKDSQSSSSKDAGKKYEDMQNKCHRCLQPARVAAGTPYGHVIRILERP